MIIDHIRNPEEFRVLFQERSMPDPYEFEFLIKNPNLFCFYSEITGKLMGFITIQKEDGKLTLSGCSVRKNLSNIIPAIIKVCEQFDEDMYALTRLKEAGLVLMRAGFKNIGQEQNGFSVYCRRH